MFNNKKFNHLFIIGVTLSVTSIFLMFYNINSNDNNLETETYSSINQFWFYILYGISLGPILEELVFDSIFLRHRIFKILGLFGLIILVFFVLNVRLINVITLIIFLCLILLNKLYHQSKVYFVLALYANAFLFSAIHFKQIEYDNLFFLSFLSRFGGHLIALWLVLNYNLFAAITYHIVKNTLLTLFAYDFYNLDFYSNQSDFKSINTKQFYIEYAETSLISKHKIRYSDTLWNCNSCKFTDFYQHLDDRKLSKIKQSNKLIYDINITIKTKQHQPKAIILENLDQVLKSNQLITE
ncbi:hypothetical protein [Psychroflexus sp. ALD_RP9]|uniref:hypothetical protein n=1 Tax=Psychroflexus sp. ALD_RP9 TaxID=2777186 RepID=UPI001A8F08E0|nr:hypothetical protein [Psychroflexus sp. ALD_RP9]QSS98232.1 hypothetical protein IMZ30_05805 [Psychroflexus sp. ALD_RP9]